MNHAATTVRIVATVLAIWMASVALPATAADVDPFIGTGGTAPWFSGNTTPAAARPFGLVQLGPNTDSGAASGYAAADRRLRGFSATHLSGAGCRALGDVPVLPLVGPLPADPGATTVAFDKASERAAPGRYSVVLDNGVSAAMAADDRAGLLRFAYPADAGSRLIVKDGDARFPSDREVAVRATGGGFCGSANQYDVHVLYRFDQPVRTHGTWAGGAWVGFGRSPVVRVQVGVSFVDATGARRNLTAAHLGWSVGRLADEAAATWDRELSRIEPSGGTDEQRTLFETALYHALLHPSTISDADGRYPGFDGRVHELPTGERQLSAISGWDFYRTQVQLLAWLRPDVASQVVRSLRRDAQQGGFLPTWPLVGSETGVMDGDSAAPIVATAYAFGARDWPLDDLVTRLAQQPRPATDHPASTALEYALDDFAVSRLARSDGREALAARYLERSGSWRAGVSGDGFEEGNAEQYTWGGVPQDVSGLLATIDDPLARLDDFFTELNAGAVAPHAWLGNQPSLGSPWVYYWLGRPGRTQDVVDRARAELWTAAPDGLPGNDDLGALSAWYVWTSLGLYPLTPGTANVAVGVPAFDEIVVRPRGGAPTTIRRTGDGAHVAGLTVDGRGSTRSWLDLAPGSRPGTIRVDTLGIGAPVWGTGPDDVPPSYSR